MRIINLKQKKNNFPIKKMYKDTYTKIGLPSTCQNC